MTTSCNHQSYKRETLIKNNLHAGHHGKLPTAIIHDSADSALPAVNDIIVEDQVVVANENEVIAG